jgi:hypothetical protein
VGKRFLKAANSLAYIASPRRLMRFASIMGKQGHILFGEYKVRPEFLLLILTGLNKSVEFK